MITKLWTFIESSSLPPDDKKLWRDFLWFLDDKTAEGILAGKEDLLFLTKNIKDKLSALQQKDNDAWEKIIKEETAYLNAIS